MKFDWSSKLYDYTTPKAVHQCRLAILARQVARRKVLFFMCHSLSKLKHRQ